MSNATRVPPSEAPAAPPFPDDIAPFSVFQGLATGDNCFRLVWLMVAGSP